MERAAVRVSCQKCGDVVVTFEDIWLSQCADTEVATYQFVCPDCKTLVTTRVANPKILDLLVTAGVPLARWHLSPELEDSDRCGPPITLAEVEAFARQMNPS